MVWGSLGQFAELRLDELRHLPHHQWLPPLKVRGFGRRLTFRITRVGIARLCLTIEGLTVGGLAVAVGGFAGPHGVRSGELRARKHEGFGAPADSAGYLFHRPARGDGAILLEQGIRVSGFRARIAVLDQQPVGSLAPVPVASHPHQYPTSLQPAAVQREFKVALVEGFFRR